MTEVNLSRVAIILLFAISFAIIGTFAPVLYATYTPESSIVEVHSFEAQSTTTQSQQHYVCFDRTVHQPATGKVFTELYLVDKNENRVEVDSRTMQRYFQEGRAGVVTPFSLPDDIKSGEYTYLLVIRMELADGRVTRDFAYTSDTFTVTKGESMNQTAPHCRL